jgi:cyclophilin family peptidyl-prolyl cis-trans isomerase
VIDNFMVQGGGYDSKYQQKPTRPPVVLEASNGLKNEIGTIAMARTSDPNSATSQFFINVADNAKLNAPSPDGFGYTVFGKVVSGTETIQKIRTTATGPGGPFPTDAPKTPILINSATLEKKS